VGWAGSIYTVAIDKKIFEKTFLNFLLAYNNFFYHCIWLSTNYTDTCQIVTSDIHLLKVVFCIQCG